MTTPVSFPEGLLDRLPSVRGRYTQNAPLDKVTWFRVGGPAEVLFKPHDGDDLADFLSHKPADVPVTFLGVGSNLLVRDGGVPGVTIRLGRAFADMQVTRDEIHVGAGCLDGNVARLALENNLSGLEFLSGIPGTIGGALRMNAGAYGQEVKDVLIRANAISATGERKEFTCADLDYSYRHCGLSDGWVFTHAVFKGTKAAHGDIQAEMTRIQESRSTSQPIRSRTGGSTFANPDGYSAWKLVDEAGCRGLTIGGAQVSEQHCNFLINTGDASADDLETLGETVRKRVKETSGVELRWEIKRIGLKKGERS